MKKQYSHLVILCFFSALLISCSSTKQIDGTGLLKAPEEDSKKEESEALSYPEDIAGTVTDLYGDASDLASNRAYQDAISEDPGLQYNIVYFAFDQTDLIKEGKSLIERHANYLKEHPDVFVLLEGHADTQGSEGYNLALGERRSNSVRDLLISYGVAQEQISTISFGEEKPAVWGDTNEVYSKNRRVEIIYQ